MPGTDISTIDDLLQPSAEEHAALAAWNDTAGPFSSQATIDHLILAQAARQPDAPAAVCGEQCLSYGALSAASAGFAARLAAVGAGPGSIVAIALPPGLERLTAVLAVLRTGAAYLPLDLEHPAARLRFQIRDAGVNLLVAGTELAATLSSEAGARPLPFDATPAPPPPVLHGPTATAYVIYTSGSTGQPKGVAVTHRSLVNRLEWMRDDLAVSADDRVLHKTAFGFDVSVWEQLLPLLAGAAVVIADSEERRDAAALAGLIARHRVSVAHFVPTLLDAFLEAGDISRCRSLRATVCSGEVLPRALADRAAALLPGSLYNYYGPTEATIDVTSWRFGTEDPYSFVPIGRPIRNVTAHVLSDDLQPVPPGAEGELYIGGVAVAAGYLHRPRLTAERFLPDPFSALPGARLYRTGDRARQHAGGVIEFLGRRDGQVKLRGFRIETGEIEHHLLSHPSVRSVAVALAEAGNGPAGLVAATVLRAAAEPSTATAELRAWLAARLPDYMIPAVVPVPALPRTPGGKLDRTAVARLARPALPAGAGPANAAERLLADLWSELLGRTELPVDADFFALGGDSIAAIRLAARARTRGLIFDVKAVFDHPTVRALAGAARTCRNDPAAASPAASQDCWLTAAPSAVRANAPVAVLALAAAKSNAAAMAAAMQRLARHLVARGALALWPEPSAAILAEADSVDAAADCAVNALGPPPAAPLAMVPVAQRRIVLACHPAIADWPSLALIRQVLPVLLADPAADIDAALGSFLSWPTWRDAASALPPPSPPAALSTPAVEPGGGQHRCFVIPPDFVARMPHCGGGADDAVQDVLAALLVHALAEAGAMPARLELADSRAWAAGSGWTVDRLLGRLAVRRQVDIADGGVAIPDLARRLRSCRHGAHREPAGPDAPALTARLVHLDLGEPNDTAAEPDPEWPAALARHLAASADLAAVSLRRGDTVSVQWCWHADRSAIAAAADAMSQALAAPDAAAGWRPLRVPSDFPMAETTPAALTAEPLASAADAYPLSPMQAGMLLFATHWPESDAYLNQNVMELRGTVDLAAFRGAVAIVVNRYEALRTGYRWTGSDRPVQFVATALQPSIPLLDWSGDDPASHDDRLHSLLADDRCQPFDLAEPGLFRLRLVRLAADRHLVVWTHHHILLDGWCLSLVWGDVFRAYAALVEGHPQPPRMVRPYRDYVRWLADRATSGDDRQFWRRYLNDFAVPTRFSAKPGSESGPFRTRRLAAGVQRTTALGERAAAARVTVNAVVQTAWSLMLAARTGAEDVIHGVSVAGRPPDLAGAETMVGLFINTVPLRIRHRPDATLTALLQEAQASLALAGSRGHVPLADILSAWPGRRRHDDRLFDSLIAFENYPEDNLPQGRVGGLTVIDRFAVEKTEYPIGLIVLPGRDLELHLNYDTTHFAEPEIDRLAEQLLWLLDRLLAEPQTPLRDLALLPPAEEQRLTTELAVGPAAAPPAASLTDLLAAAADSPAPAVIEDARTWSRPALAAWAGRIAAALAGNGVQWGDRVGICLNRSAGFVAAVVALQQAGCVAVMIDPAQPSERRRRMAADAGVAAVLCTAKTGFDAPGVPPLDPDDWREPGSIAPAPPIERPPPAAVAVFFTSGSTGSPKGVICSHRGLANRICATHALYGVGEPPPRGLLIAASGFDIVLWELFFPLAAGGTVVVAPPQATTDIGMLTRLVHRHAIDVLHLVPSLLALFLDHPEAARCDSLRLVVSGGEPLTPEVVRRFHACGLNAALWQAYGPTEAAVSVTDHRCHPADGYASKVPIGRPLAGTRIYVLDRYLRPVPQGTRGDIYIGGDGLAAGYVGRPGETAAAFLPDPFARKPGARIYRTGDCARWTADGELEFCGRGDWQIKIRGQRIEPAEVEATIAAHPEVSRAAVVIETAADGSPALAAVVVPRQTGDTAIATVLRRWLAARLPATMVPQRIVTAPALPLTPNGKLDRRNLVLPPESARPAAGRGPATPLERCIAAAWEQVLGTPPPDVDADFFDCGGNSLAAMRYLAALRRTLGDDEAVGIPQIFKAPSVAGLAELLLTPHVGSARAQVIEIDDGGAATPLVLVHPVEGLALCYRGLRRQLGSRRIYGFSNPRFGRRGPPFASLEEMAGIYIEWIRRLVGDGPVALGGWSFGGLVALAMAQAMARHGGRISCLLLIDTYGPDWRGSGSGPEARLQAHGLAADDPAAADLAHEIASNRRLAATAPLPRYDGPVVLLQAGDSRANPACLANGWSADVLPNLDVIGLPGRHDTLFSEPDLTTTAAALRQALER